MRHSVATWALIIAIPVATYAVLFLATIWTASDFVVVGATNSPDMIAVSEALHKEVKTDFIFRGDKIYTIETRGSHADAAREILRKLDRETNLCVIVKEVDAP